MRNTKEVKIGNVTIGGNNRIAIQSMTNTKTADKEATLEQIKSLAAAGCDIVRFTVNDMDAANAIPYYVENADDWILQRFDRQMYEMFTNELEGVKNVGHILLGETLEELSEYVINAKKSEKLPRGRTLFSQALERFEGDTVFMPLNSLGVLQMQFLKNSRNNMRFVKMLDYDAVSSPAYSLFYCEKLNGTPIYIACDGNMSKLKRALRQAEKADYKFNPNIFALNKEQEDFIVNHIEKTTGKYYVCHRLTERIVKNKLFANLDTPFQRQAVEKDGVTFPVKALKR